MRPSSSVIESESTRLVQSNGHVDNGRNGFQAHHMELGQNGYFTCSFCINYTF